MNLKIVVAIAAIAVGIAIVAAFTIFGFQFGELDANDYADMDLTIAEELIEGITIPPGPDDGECAALIQLHQSVNDQPFDDGMIGVRETALQNYIALHCA